MCIEISDGDGQRTLTCYSENKSLTIKTSIIEERDAVLKFPSSLTTSPNTALLFYLVSLKSPILPDPHALLRPYFFSEKV